MGIPEPTDIMTFPSDDEPGGDIVISVEQADRQRNDDGWKLAGELRFLVAARDVAPGRMGRPTVATSYDRARHRAIIAPSSVESRPSNNSMKHIGGEEHRSALELRHRRFHGKFLQLLRRLRRRQLRSRRRRRHPRAMPFRAIPTPRTSGSSAVGNLCARSAAD